MIAKDHKISSWVEVALIVGVTALVYLPNLSQATIYRDDWYYALDRSIGGPGAFQAMFEIDRPARGWFFEAYYQLFGIHPLPYHLSSYVWRLLSSLGALWLFKLLWPKQRYASLYMALLFSLYPGYIRWMEGFEDQPQIASLFFQVISIALMVKAIQANHPLRKVGLWADAMLTGWIYVALVDFAIGMEVFRWLCVAIVVRHKWSGISPSQKFVSFAREWALAALIPAIFLFWRLLVFHNERPDTDVGLQLSYFAASPVLRGLWWLVHLFQSVINTALLAWFTPRLQEFFGFRLKEIGIGILIMAGTLTLITLPHVLSTASSIKKEDQQGASEHGDWQKEALLLGLGGVIAGLVPTIIANRYATLQAYSHYTLPASLASVCLLVGLLFYITDPHIRFVGIAILDGGRNPDALHGFRTSVERGKNNRPFVATSRLESARHTRRHHAGRQLSRDQLWKRHRRRSWGRQISYISRSPRTKSRPFTNSRPWPKCITRRPIF